MDANGDICSSRGSVKGVLMFRLKDAFAGYEQYQITVSIPDVIQMTYEPYVSEELKTNDIFSIPEFSSGFNFEYKYYYEIEFKLSGGGLTPRHETWGIKLGVNGSNLTSSVLVLLISTAE